MMQRLSKNTTHSEEWVVFSFPFNFLRYSANSSSDIFSIFSANLLISILSSHTYSFIFSNFFYKILNSNFDLFYTFTCSPSCPSDKKYPSLSARSISIFILLPFTFNFFQLLHQRILKNNKSWNKTILYQHNQFINFIVIIYMNRGITFF